MSLNESSLERYALALNSLRCTLKTNLRPPLVSMTVGSSKSPVDATAARASASLRATPQGSRTLQTLTEAGLATAAAAAAAAAAQGGSGVRTVSLAQSPNHRPNKVVHQPDNIAKSRKVELLQRVNDAARTYGPEIAQVSAGYGDSSKRTLIANTDGVLADDEIVRTSASHQRSRRR